METRRLSQRLRAACRPAALRGAVGLAGCLWLAAAAVAQPVYRCGPDGRSYSQQPCDGGREVEVSDPRTPQQRDEAAAQRQRLVERSTDLAAPAGTPRRAAVIHTRPLPEPEPSAATGRHKSKAAATRRADWTAVAPAPHAGGGKPGKKSKRRGGA